MLGWLDFVRQNRLRAAALPGIPFVLVRPFAQAVLHLVDEAEVFVVFDGAVPHAMEACVDGCPDAGGLEVVGGEGALGNAGESPDHGEGKDGHGHAHGETWAEDGLKERAPPGSEGI